MVVWEKKRNSESRRTKRWNSQKQTPRHEGYFPISDSQCFIGARQLKMGIRGGQKSQNGSLARIRPPFFAGGTAVTLVCFDPPLQIAQGLEAQSYNERVKELRYV